MASVFLHVHVDTYLPSFIVLTTPKARPDGTGIGLYMAKRVIVAHGGSIIFESKEGEGSEFGFRFTYGCVGAKPESLYVSRLLFFEGVEHTLTASP